MNASILYCGDTDLNGAASYLSGMMTAWGWNFDYVPSGQGMPADTFNRPRSLIILSDYPAQQFSVVLQQAAVRQIEKGCGLLMIGGWESFYGFGGNWNGTPLGSILPVEIQASDDRMNFDQSAWLSPAGRHPILDGLPWASRPPAIGGMNRVIGKPGADILLEAHAFTVSKAPTEGALSPATTGFAFLPSEKFPALVVGQSGQGRTAAFLSDVAPHWVGGFVDWGLPRFTGQANGAGAIEVGSHYAQFWKQLLTWTGNLS